MRVLLLRPRPGNERFGLGPFFRIEPLGMAYVAAALEARRHDVIAADLRFSRTAEHLVTRHRPALVGIACMHALETDDALVLAARVRRASPRSVIVVGGHSAAAYPPALSSPAVDEPLWKNQGKAWHEDLRDLRDDSRYQRITARMSLSHTTGFPNWRWFEPDRKLRITFDPGTRYGYSGEGMTFLQIVLEKITGKPLEALMRDHIFGPYGMKTSSYTWQARFEKDYAVGHHADGTSYQKTRTTPRAPRARSKRRPRISRASWKPCCGAKD
jgi:hypothetical protein